MSGEPRRPWLRVMALVGALGLFGVALWFTVLDELGHDDDRGSRTSVGAAPGTARPRGRASTPSGEDCDGEGTPVCVDGDVWATDGCGSPSRRIAECGRARCIAGACQGAAPPDPFIAACRGVSDLGVCEGDVARFCRGGVEETVDCAQLGARCVQGEEGAMCVDASAIECEPAPSRCEGQTLVRCVDAKIERVSCPELGAVCEVGGRAARCRRVAPPMSSADCGECGCAAPPEEERCNGRDDDQDGFVDEGVTCGAVPVVAFIVTDGGDLAHDRADIEAEMARINRVFSARPEGMPSDEGGGPLRFELVDLVELDQSRWAEVSDDEFFEMAASPEVHPVREEFYVPIVFADAFEVGEVPKSGASTLPHDLCGGVRRGPGQLPVGVIVVGRQRAPTTVAHELGHFLGLCHTHHDDPAVEVRPSTCDESCSTEGDGICDTPRDPGPPTCGVDGDCVARCADGASPPVANVMAYYPWCREGFSVEQLRMIREGLASRRAWHRCLGGACTCDPTQSGCPEGMGCYPFTGSGEGEGEGARWRCALDGQAPLGAACSRHRECEAGGMCVSVEGQGTCLRPCIPARAAADPACDCTAVGADGVGVCRPPSDAAGGQGIGGG